MPYEPKDWEDGPEGATPLTAAELERMETQYGEAVADATVAASEDAAGKYEPVGLSPETQAELAATFEPAGLSAPTHAALTAEINASTIAEMRFTPVGKPDGPIPNTADTGQAFTKFSSPTSPAPLRIAGGMIVHTPFSGSQSAGYLEVELPSRVRRVGALVQWPTSATGSIALVIPSAKWDTSTLPNAGFHLSMTGNGVWTLSRYSSGGTTAIASYQTHGRWGTVWGLGLVPIDVWLDTDAGSAVIIWPDGSATKVTSTYLATETGNFAIWELFENNGATDVPGAIGRIWASSEASLPELDYLTAYRGTRSENPATYNATGTLAVQFGQTLMHEATLVGNITSLSFVGTPRRGEIVHVEFVQDSTGSRTLTGANATIKWAGGAVPVLSTTPGRRDIFRFRYAGQWYEVSRSMNVQF